VKDALFIYDVNSGGKAGTEIVNKEEGKMLIYISMTPKSHLQYHPFLVLVSSSMSSCVADIR
jgi:hypothetical protein